MRVALGVLAGVALVTLGMPSGVASAHAIVEEISPPDGSALIEAPSEVVVTFSEPMRSDDLAVDVTVSGSRPAPTASAAIDPSDARRVIISLIGVTDGTYQVRLEGRDAGDLHEVVARTSFAIGEAAPAPTAPVDASAEPYESFARWIFAAGLALLIGIASVRMRWSDLPTADPRRLHWLALAGVLLVVAGRIGVLAGRAITLGGDRVDAIRTVLDTADAKRLAAVVIAVGCVWLVELPQRATWLDVPVRAVGHFTVRQAINAVGIANLAVLSSWGSHSAIDGTTSPVILAAKSAHLIGVGLWVGVLAVVLVLSVGTNTTRASLVAMSRVALVGAVLAVVSGLVAASDLVVSVTALLSTPYGIALTIKVLLAVVAVLFGLAMWRGLTTRWSSVELGLLATVMLIGASMATATPAIDPSFSTPGFEIAATPPAASADDLLVGLRAIPARPGVNTLEIRIGQTRRPDPGAVTGLDVIVGDSTFEVAPNAQGLALLDGVVLPAGESPVAVVLHRAGLADASVTLPAFAETPPYDHPVRISSSPIRVPLLGVAGLVAVAAVVIIVRQGRRRSQPSQVTASACS